MTYEQQELNLRRQAYMAAQAAYDAAPTAINRIRLETAKQWLMAALGQ